MTELNKLMYALKGRFYVQDDPAGDVLERTGLSKLAEFIIDYFKEEK